MWQTFMIMIIYMFTFSLFECQRENCALHCTEHLIPKSPFPLLPLPPSYSLFFLTTFSMAGPSVEHATYHKEMSTAPLGPPVRGMVGRGRSTIGTTSHRRIHYISVVEHPIVKIDLVVKSEIFYLGGRYYLHVGV